MSLNTTSPNLVAGFTYGPFGEILEEFGSDLDGSLRRFNGKDVDNVSALSYYGARYYDSLSLSWTQADPLFRFAPDIARDEPRRMNLYAFTLNNPLSFQDPDGLQGGGGGVVEIAKQTAEVYAASKNTLDNMNSMVSGMHDEGAAKLAKEGQGKETQGMKQALPFISPAFFALELIVDCVEGNCPGPEDMGPSALGGGGAPAPGAVHPRPGDGRPGRQIANDNGVRVQSHGTNDVHKPAHAHVTGGGKQVRIGPNGKPLKGESKLSRRQRRVVKKHKKAIRKEVRKVGKANQRLQRELEKKKAQEKPKPQ